MLDRLRETVDSARSLTFEIDTGEPGRPRSIDMTLSPILDRHGACTHVLVASQDLTVRARRLRERAERFRSVFEAAHDAIILATDDRRVVEANPAAELLLGRSRAEIIGHDLFEFASSGIDVDSIWQALREAGKLNGELSFAHRDGSLRIAEVAAITHLLPGVHIGFLRDVTDRRRREAELTRSEEEVHLLTRNATDLIARHDPNGVVLYASPASRTLLGYEPEELVGRSAWELFHPDDQAELRRRLSDLPNDPYPSSVTHRIRKADGTYTWFETVMRTLRDPETGAVLELHAASRDVSDRVAAEEALRVSEARFRAAAQGALDAFTVFECKRDERGAIVDFVLVDLNRNGEELMGRGRDEVVGRGLGEMFGLKPGNPVFERYAEVVDTGVPLEEEFQLDNPPIAATWLHHQVVPLADGIAITSRDISERKQTERALQESEARYRSLIDALAEGIVLTDADGTVRAANDAAARMLGVSLQKLTGATAPIGEMPVHENGAPFALEQLPDVATRRDGGARRNVVEGLERADGSRLWLSVNARALPGPEDAPYAVVTSYADITDRVRAEERLRRSERRFRTLVQNSSDLITVVDRDGRLRYATPSAHRVFGRPEGWGLGETMWELIHPDDAERVASVYLKCLEHPGLSQTVEFRIQNADGTWRQIEAVGKNLLDDPAIRGVVSNARDVTDRRRLEDALAHSQKMEAVGRLAGGIAHDFNNLLTAISGYTTLLLGDLAPDDEHRADLEEIDRAAARAAGLVDQLLAFSRKKMLQLTVLDLNEVIASTEGMLRRLLGADIRFRTSLAHDLVGARADRGQIEQVILNLVVNARDALRPGGRLTVATSTEILDDAYVAAHPDATAGPHVVLSVSDDGVGMDEATKAQAFEPFFTTKELGEGTGLGLSIVYGIVAQSGGHVTVESAPDRGSVFRIYLPGVAIEGRARPAAVEPEPPRPGRETVLVVEDERAVRSLSCEVLSRLGYEVLSAGDGRAALEVAASHAGPIHLLVTDVVLPHLRGVALASQLSDVRPDLRVLYISGYTQSAIVDDGVLREGVNFLAKPFRPDDLGRRAREVLDGVVPPRETGPAAADHGLEGARP